MLECFDARTCLLSLRHICFFMCTQLNRGEESHDMAGRSGTRLRERQGNDGIYMCTVLHVSVIVCMFVVVSCCVCVCGRKARLGGKERREESHQRKSRVNFMKESIKPDVH
jgi:hypothetical protein